jgi:hypothetical protein
MREAQFAAPLIRRILRVKIATLLNPFAEHRFLREGG